MRLSLRSACAGAGGGGSTPDSGSLTRPGAERSTGESTSTTNATTNGSAGLNALAMMLFVGRYWYSSCWNTPSMRPPAYASGMLAEAAEHRGRDRRDHERLVGLVADLAREHRA